MNEPNFPASYRPAIELWTEWQRQSDGGLSFASYLERTAHATPFDIQRTVAIVRLYLRSTGRITLHDWQCSELDAAIHHVERGL